MLNEQNIEERIFEYHEGLLDATQKAELMEYLHQNPEWQREFAIWAQSRLYDEPIAAKALEKKLLHNNKPFGYRVKSSLVVVATIAIIALYFTKPNTKLKSDTKKTPTKAASTTLTETQKLFPSSTKNLTTKPKTKLKEKKKEEEELTHAVLAPLTLIQDTLPIVNKAHIDTSIRVIASESTKIDTAVYKEELVKKRPENNKVEPKKKKKRKIKMSLKPTSDIVPTNSNF